MDRRLFLKSSLPVVSATMGTVSLGITGCIGQDTAPDAALGATQFPAFRYITRNPAYTDYRPTPDPTGTQVIFERNDYANGKTVGITTLYLATNIMVAVPTPTPFLVATPPYVLPAEQTRPDWNWKTGIVAYTGRVATTTPGTFGPLTTFLASATGETMGEVGDTAGTYYPIWTGDDRLIVYRDESTTSRPTTVPPPVTQLVSSPGGGVWVENLNGTDSAGVQVFGGFAAPRKTGPATKIAFAGQPALRNWGTPNANQATPAYGQDYNYVFLNSYAGSGPATSAPLETGASITAFVPAFQGRAPYWSPDGNYIVFESNRSNTKNRYALFLANVAKGTAPVQLTDEGYDAQHGKFLPNGTTLVFTCLQTIDDPLSGCRGIAMLDISPYL
jgi:WD40-like Beta Propeller Repeat